MDATLGTVSRYERAHGVDRARVEAIVAAIRAGVGVPPVLAVEDVGNGAVVLDGHHRLAAMSQIAREDGTALDAPAYIVTMDDYCALLDAEFGGEMPDRMCDIDRYITVNGAAYCR
jgi:ParB-like chromosome segregation protein Spo0J